MNPKKSKQRNIVLCLNKARKYVRNKKKPAFLENSLQVNSSINDLNRVKINFIQKIFRKSDLLIQAEVLIIPVNSLGKITKMPDEIYSSLEKFKS